MSRTARLKQHQTNPGARPVRAVRPDPQVWRQALKLAGGDKGRLLTRPDGSVTVRNPPHM